MQTPTRGFFGLEGASFADIAQAGGANSLIVNDVAVARTGSYYNRVFRSVASATFTGGERTFTAVVPPNGQVVKGRFQWWMQVIAYPSVSDLRVGGFSGQRASRLEMDTTGHVRVYSDWSSPNTSSYSSGIVPLNQWVRCRVDWFWSRVGSVDNTTVEVFVDDEDGNSVATASIVTVFGGELAVSLNTDRVVWGNGPAGGPNATYDLYFDDLLWMIQYTDDEATETADLLDTFPVASKVFPMLVTGQGAINTFTGTFADVDEIPNSGADSQLGDNGEDTTVVHATAQAIGVSDIEAVKVYANALTTSGTQNQAILIGGVAIDASVNSTTTDDDAGATPVAYSWGALLEADFNSLEFGFRSRVGGQVVTLHNIFGEVLGAEAPEEEHQFSSGESEIGLTWAEFTNRLGDRKYWTNMARPLPDPDTYFGGYKEDRVIQFHPIRRAFSDRSGQYEGVTFGVRLHDLDRDIRGQLGTEATRMFFNAPLVERMISDEGRRALLTPRTVARGFVRAYSIDSPLMVELRAQDPLSIKFASTNRRDQIPTRVITVEDFPGSDLQSATLGGGVKDASIPVPIIYGSMSDKNEQTTPGTAGLEKPANLTAVVIGGAGTETYTYAVTALDNRNNQWNNFNARWDHAGETDASYVTVTGAPRIDQMSATRYVQLDWDDVAGAHHYRIYGRAAGQTLNLNLLDSANAAGSGYGEERYNDGERNGRTEIDIEKTDSHPPEFNNTRINPTTVDSGFGLVPIISVGTRLLADGNTYHEFLVCGHAIKSIDSWYLDGVREANATADAGADYLIPGYAGWNAVNGATTYRDYNGHRYTVIFMKQDTKGEEVASGEKKVTLNVQGIETIGDGSGTVITDLIDQYYHAFNNWISQTYQTDVWLDPLNFEDDPTLSIVDEASFTAAKAVGESRVSGGYIGAFIIGSDGSRLSARDLIAQFNLSADVDCGFNRKCQFMINMTDERVESLETGAQLFDTVDIVSESFNITDELDQMFNHQPFSFARDYTGRTGNTWHEEKEVINAAAETEAREELIAPVAEFYMLRAGAVAQDVAERRNRRSLTPPRLVELKLPLVGTSFELGDILLVTHFSGVSTTGWVTRPIRVHRVEVEPDQLLVTITGYDMKQIIDILTTAGTGGSGDSWNWGTLQSVAEDIAGDDDEDVELQTGMTPPDLLG